MGSSLETDLYDDRLHQGPWAPRISSDARITLPGISPGLSIPVYRQLVSLYDGILEADARLQSYRDELSLEADCPQAITPLTPSNRHPFLLYKREDRTAVMAYKLRGALNAMAKAMETGGYFRFLAVSTGNHALGVLKSAEVLRPDSVRIVVPKNTIKTKLDKLMAKSRALSSQGLQAEIIQAGDTFDEAKQWAMAQNQAEYYLDPYADPWVVAGQGTIGLEILRQLTPTFEAHGLPQELVLISPVGGGGLLGGTATALAMATAWDPRFRSVQLRVAGLRLRHLNSELGDAIRVKQPGDINRLLFRALDVTLQTMDDAEMARGMAYVRDDIGVRIEGASGGSLVPVLQQPERFAPTDQRCVVCLLSGGNVSQ
jgi:threonine dehydratase